MIIIQLRYSLQLSQVTSINTDEKMEVGMQTNRDEILKA
jgi:hypothetical protein